MSEFGPIGDLPHVGAANVPALRAPGMWRSYRLAGWWRRVFAALINYGGSAVIAETLTLPFPTTGGTLRAANVLWVVVAVVMVGVNPWHVDVGKSFVGITTVQPVWSDGRPALAEVGNIWRIVRVLAHAFDYVFLIGFFLVGMRWNRRSIADSVAGTVVVEARRSQLSLLPAQPFPGGKRDSGPAYRPTYDPPCWIDEVPL